MRAKPIPGFDVQLPFEATPGDVFRAMRGEMIEVVHTAEESMTVRKAKESSDISGDYNSYPYVSNSGPVTLKGRSSDEVCLATWSADGCSYSISVDEPVPEDDMLAIVSKMR